MTVMLNPGDPGLTALLATGFMGSVFLILLALYTLVSKRRIRFTGTYLGGEDESIVSNPSPSPGNLYWGFIKRFARSLYRDLRDKMHTGSLQDWLLFMTGWYGFLVLTAVVLGAIYVAYRGWW